MSQTAQNRTPKKREAFEPIDSYERLIKLREESPDAFLLQTSEATRRALHYYEELKAKSERQRATI
jgi:hypothetical protein